MSVSLSGSRFGCHFELGLFGESVPGAVPVRGACFPALMPSLSLPGLSMFSCAVENRKGSNVLAFCHIHHSYINRGYLWVSAFTVATHTRYACMLVFILFPT